MYVFQAYEEMIKEDIMELWKRYKTRMAPFIFHSDINLQKRFQANDLIVFLTLIITLKIQKFKICRAKL